MVILSQLYSKYIVGHIKLVLWFSLKYSLKCEKYTFWLIKYTAIKCRTVLKPLLHPMQLSLLILCNSFWTSFPKFFNFLLCCYFSNYPFDSTMCMYITSQIFIFWTNMCFLVHFNNMFQTIISHNLVFYPTPYFD